MNDEALKRGFFVTGTDTGVGKTRVSVALIHALRERGLRVAAMKPVAAGAEPWQYNDDVVALMQAMNVRADAQDVNPYAFNEPIAPHIAAAMNGVRVEPERIAAAYARLARVADTVVVEGAGGLLVPLNESADIADLPRMLCLPVVLVVGLRLGCINHARLAVEAIRARGLEWAGWIGNHIDPEMAAQEDNLAALKAWLPEPCLGVQPYLPETGLYAISTAWLDLAAVSAHGD
jgi:dethiobiotin synthetase